MCFYYLFFFYSNVVFSVRKIKTYCAYEQIYYVFFICSFLLRGVVWGMYL